MNEANDVKPPDDKGSASSRCYPSDFREIVEKKIWQKIGFGDVKVCLVSDGTFGVKHSFNGVAVRVKVVSGESAEMCVDAIVTEIESARTRFLGDELNG